MEATRRITARPELAATRVLVLTTYGLDSYVVEALRSGASGFLLKDALLTVSYATAKTHVSHLLTKLGARDRAQLVMIAHECGVVVARDE